jgi:peroxiredoxin/Tfp pilus assembly protein PilF
LKMTKFYLRRREVRWLLLLGLGIGCLFSPMQSQSPWTTGQTAIGQASGDRFEDELQKALDQLKQRKYEDALKSFKRANELRGKNSAECFLGMAQAYQGLQAYKNVIESCEKAIEFGGSDKHLLAHAYNVKGLAFQAQADGKDQKKLHDAELAFRQGIAADAGQVPIHFNLGVTLMQENQDPDGIAELKKYLELLPNAASAAEARKMIENPRRAREDYAPDVSITTSDGELISLEDLHGKVVLLDFWGTWCPPCRASVPDLRSLHKKYGKDSSFVMIGISSDSDEEKWKDFTAKNQMVWAQHLDRERRVQRAFSVRAFPTYIVIDQEGIIRFRSVGTSLERNADLESAIRKQLKNAAKTQPTE